MQTDEIVLDYEVAQIFLSATALRQLATANNNQLLAVMEEMDTFVSGAEYQLGEMMNTRWRHGIAPYVALWIAEILGNRDDAYLRRLYNRLVLASDKLKPNEFLLRFTLEYLDATVDKAEGYMFNVDYQRVVGPGPRDRELFRNISEFIPIRTGSSRVDMIESLTRFLIDTWHTHPLNSGLDTYLRNGKPVRRDELTATAIEALQTDRAVVYISHKFEIRDRAGKNAKLITFTMNN